MKETQNRPSLLSVPGTQTSEEYILHFLDTIDEGIYVIDRQWRCIYLNKQAAELVERPCEVMLGQNVWELFPEAVDLLFYQRAHEAVNKQQATRVEAFYPPLNKWFECHFYPFQDGVTVVLRDTSDLRKAQAELQKRMQEFLTLAENIPDIVTRLDRNFRYLYVNPAIEKITGIPASTFLGKSYREVGLSEDRCTFFDTYLAQVFKTGEPITVTYSFIEWDGERHYLSSLVPEANAQGEIVSALVITHDVTASKELEQRKDNFISMASHELRTPITILKGMAQILKRRLTKRGIMDLVVSLAKMEGQIDRLTRLVNELLDVSKIQADRLDYKEEPVDIDALVKETIEMLQPTALQHKLILTGTAHAMVKGDKERLEQVLTNLITNAIKFSPQAEKVDISVAASHDAVRIEIRDYGTGIAKAYQEKIFDRFFRIEDEKTKGVAGLGMGLYITSEIVKRHNGKITVESEEGKGSTFSISLPR